MKIYDCHMHSENSHDGKTPVEQLCRHAAELNISGITVTDHFDCEKYKSTYDCKHIIRSKEDIKKAKKLFENNLEVYTGVEIADRIYNERMGKYCIDTGGFDFVLASLHSTSTGKRIKTDFTSFKSFALTTPEEDKAFLDLYYKNLVRTAENDDFDSMAHLTYPLRYLNGSYGKNITLDDYAECFEKIFHVLIYREKSLEINTSGLKTDWHMTMPSEKLLKTYYSLGGRLITIGSDAHRPEHMCCGFDYAFDMLRKIGFEHYYYYKKRKPVPVSL